MNVKELGRKAEEYSALMRKVEEEVSRVIVGQKEVVRKLLTALLADGHVVVEGVPGLAKTLTIKTLAETMRSSFVRIQFTPDLLPADITGTKVYHHKTSTFKTMKGPVFTNFLLADEINRAPPKVQSALLEAMQERQVTIQGETYPLQKPFLVMATQNPIESEGTYPLPEAQLDRFAFKILIRYPSKEEEEEIITRFTEGKTVKAKPVLTSRKVLEMQSFTQKVHAEQSVKRYVSEIVDATRNPSSYGLSEDWVEYGASPRASLWLILGAKANALLKGKAYVTPQDVKDVACEVLRHRIILRYEAEAEGVTPDKVIDEILSTVKVP